MSTTSRLLYKILTLGQLVGGCISNSESENLLRGTIAYPFGAQSEAIGYDSNKASDRFVIRTISGSTEYVVEIPHAGRDYDVEVPIAGNGSDEAMKHRVKNAQVTDRELVSNMPRLSKATERERAMLDRAFGAGEKGGPRQAPSYTLGINKINDLYKRGKYEFALIEINNLMTFYPTSVKLYKMKGTVLIKLRNYELAERSWNRAAELAPGDPVIKKGLARLKRQIEQNKQVSMKKANDVVEAQVPQ